MTGLTALLISLTLQAASPQQGYQASLEAGRRAFDNFALAEANADFERAAAFAPSSEDKAVALVWLGALRAENADFDGARGRFREALSLDRNVPVSVNLSPAIHRLMEEERAKLPASPSAAASSATSMTYVDQPLAETPRWALLSGGAVAAVGVLAVGGGAMVGLAAVTQRDAASTQAFQSEAIAEYQKAREGVLWANVLYGAGGVLVAAGGGLAVASMMGVDQ
jgi:tetratricopeptide (TPR) repeat protein